MLTPPDVKLKSKKTPLELLRIGADKGLADFHFGANAAMEVVIPGVVATVVLWALAMQIPWSGLDFSQFFKLLLAHFLTLLSNLPFAGFLDGFEFDFPVYDEDLGHVVVLTETAAGLASTFTTMWIKKLLAAGCVFVLSGIGGFKISRRLSWYFIEKGDNMAADVHLRGAKVVNAEELTEIVLRNNEKLKEKGLWKDPLIDLTLGAIKLSLDRETQGFFIAGSTGSGKTVAQKAICRQVRAANQKMFVYDPAPEFIKEFYRDGDVNMNQLDARAITWSLRAELRSKYDYVAFAASFFPVDPTKKDEFVFAAQSVFAGMLEKCETIHGENGLLDVLKWDQDSIADFLSDTHAAGSIDVKNPKGTAVVLGILRNKLRVFEFVHDPKPGEKVFSLRDWISNDDDRRWVFATCPEAHRELLKPLIGFWFDTISREIMSLTPNTDLPRAKQRRIWLMLEELPSLPPLLSLEGLTAKGRKYGCVWVITAQDPAQIEALYTPELASAMLQNCNTWLIYRCNNFKTAEGVSKLIGQYEEIEKQESIAAKIDAGADGTTYGSQRIVRDAVLPSEIQKLEDLHCYVLMFGPYPTAIAHIPYESHPEVAPALVEREDLKINFSPVESKVIDVINVETGAVIDYSTPAPATEDVDDIYAEARRKAAEKKAKKAQREAARAAAEV